LYADKQLTIREWLIMKRNLQQVFGESQVTFFIFQQVLARGYEWQIFLGLFLYP
jgi:hypothetical protein